VIKFEESGNGSVLMTCSIRVTLFWGRWCGGLRLTWPKAHSVRREAEMTDWIDQLGARLTDEEKSQNLQYAIKLRDDRLIEGRAPAFFRAFSQVAQALAAELNEEL
jgi:hypothetical protein